MQGLTGGILDCAQKNQTKDHFLCARFFPLPWIRLYGFFYLSCSLFRVFLLPPTMHYCYDQQKRKRRLWGWLCLLLLLGRAWGSETVIQYKKLQLYYVSNDLKPEKFEKVSDSYSFTIKLIEKGKEKVSPKTGFIPPKSPNLQGKKYIETVLESSFVGGWIYETLCEAGRDLDLAYGCSLKNIKVADKKITLQFELSYPANPAEAPLLPKENKKRPKKRRGQTKPFPSLQNGSQSFSPDSGKWNVLFFWGLTFDSPYLEEQVKSQLYPSYSSPDIEASIHLSISLLFLFSCCIGSLFSVLPAFIPSISMPIV